MIRARIYHRRRLIQSIESSDPFVLGRRDTTLREPDPVSMCRSPEGAKLVVADDSTVKIPRRWLRISLDSRNHVMVENIHASSGVGISSERDLAPRERRSFEHEFLIDLGCDMAMRVQLVRDLEGDDAEFRSLAIATPSPVERASIEEPTTIRRFAPADAERVAKMLRLALHVMQQAAGSDAFFQAAVTAASQIVSLDRTVILIRDPSDAHVAGIDFGLGQPWSIVAEHSSPHDAQPTSGSMSRSILQRVVKNGTTVIHDPEQAGGRPASSGLANAPSLMSVRCATASPILNRKREVIGVLYGDRRTDDGSQTSNRISDIEATLVEVIAGAVASGIARKEEERMRSKLSEHFSPKVADAIVNNPKLLDGQDVEVTVLFCDIRGFSSVTEKLGPKKSIEWINDVMSELSQCVIDRDGVLVDYVGDELLAMWGAPDHQPNHANLAIDAARSMMVAIEVLRARWANILPQRFGAGIGINTGPARVGNIGSRQKFKYGPLGNTVNVGSRLQSATKQIGADCLVSGSTIQAAGDSTLANISRRIAEVNVVGIDQSIPLYQIIAAESHSWSTMASTYRDALSDFEGQRLEEALSKITILLRNFPEDGPSQKLRERAQVALKDPSAPFSPKWGLTNK